MKLIQALQDFVDENNINRNIDVDDEMAYLMFTSASELGQLQCGIQIDEATRYLMIYLIDFNRLINKKSMNKVLNNINSLNVNTKIGCFQLFNTSEGDFVRYYLGFPADDVTVDETVIYNLLAESLNIINQSHELIEDIES